MIYKKIDNRLKQSPKRVTTFFSNVIAGVLAGGFIATLLGVIQKYEKINWIMPSITQIIIIIALFLLFYSVGVKIINSLRKNREDLTGYNYNIFAGLIASILLAILLNIPIWWIRPIVAIVLTPIFLLILYLISGRKRRDKK
ncbi:hypothetical protein A2647_05080 [Candidatus Nomurabacteria bacterium RIFCSPHIGHO2_01_FULL_40_24b]|uniref:Uncharacterized protein n=1 Tax=Candidatus Nomurabacteria bacterium RIFCSPHIGHO2_01_FULL_40_24b TaxID=1801739 RepID=A0A1F6V7V4_9BACT|nr:MAG: hypothetical protein A2647_05080 [Candidatus Nomurabacteria bacterium RIFCSPHIGHO2_01_FULL_40_24b]